jgi:ribosomal protein S18 acetylase RimI-like enzyme
MASHVEDTGGGTVLLRPAQPDPAEGPPFARYLDQAAEGFFGFLLGADSETITAAAFLEPGHALSWENVIFAERDGRLVGMSLAYTGARHRGFSDEPLTRAAGRAALRMNVIRTLLFPLWRILDSVQESDFYLHGLAVDPDLRGAGIGSILMDDAEARGRAGGSTRLALDVAAKNTRAQQLYARRGMIEESEWPNSRLLPTVMVRMVKGL